MTTRTINAWIETIKTIRGTRFIVVEEGILFAGRRNQVCSSWADRRGARAYIDRNHRALQPGDCPLPRVSDEERAAYLADGAERRARVAAKAGA